jgi:hypothetical protein
MARAPRHINFIFPVFGGLQIVPVTVGENKPSKVAPADGPHFQLIKQAIMETLAPPEVFISAFSMVMCEPWVTGWFVHLLHLLAKSLLGCLWVGRIRVSHAKPSGSSVCCITCQGVRGMVVHHGV